MTNPYKVLGMNKGDDIELLRAKYEELKAIYSEQRFKEGVEGNEGAKKLTELEDAWSMILADYDVKTAEEVDSSDYSKVEALIKEGKLSEAQTLMDNVVYRDGKWHYYQSVIYYKREWMQESKKQLELAIECDPNNQKYRDTLDRLIKVMGNPNTDPRNMGVPPEYEQPQMSGNFLSNCCMAYCCTELCCNAMRCCG